MGIKWSQVWLPNFKTLSPNCIVLDHLNTTKIKLRLQKIDPLVNCFLGSNWLADTGTNCDFRPIVKNASKNKHQSEASKGCFRVISGYNLIRISGVIGKARFGTCGFCLANPRKANFNSQEEKDRNCKSSIM